MSCCLKKKKNNHHLSSTVVDQLHRPPTLILDPNKNSSICVAGGQFLERLVPSHQHHLTHTQHKRGGKKVIIKKLSIKYNVEAPGPPADDHWYRTSTTTTYSRGQCCSITQQHSVQQTVHNLHWSVLPPLRTPPLLPSPSPPLPLWHDSAYYQRNNLKQGAALLSRSADHVCGTRSNTQHRAGFSRVYIF